MGGGRDTNDETDEMEEGGYEVSKLSNLRGIAIKGGIVLAVIALVAVLFMTLSTRKSKARFVLSDREIVQLDEEMPSKTSYEAGETIYFLINRLNGKILNASQFTIEISREDNEKNSESRRISYDIGKEFIKLRSIIPSDYFTISGKYMIKSYLDGKTVSSDEITIK